MRKNNIPGISYAFTDNGIELPIVDITHPLFTSSIDEKAYKLSWNKSSHTINMLNKMPGFIKRLFIKVSNVENSYLSGIRTLIYKLGPNLIQEEAPELLKGRKIEIDIFDIDTFGPNFAKRCINVLKISGQRFYGLDITLRTIPYDWRNPKDLVRFMLEKSGWIHICSSEGGLFEYGSEDEIVQNLEHLYTNSSKDMRIVGTMIFDKNEVNPVYLGFAEFTGIQIRFLGLDGLNGILSKTGWVLEKTKEVDTVCIVFTLSKGKRVAL